MSDQEHENGEEAIEEKGRNETQQRIDEEGASEQPTDASWNQGEWGETEQAGKEGQEPA
jgi:hypothetical protein